MKRICWLNNINLIQRSYFNLLLYILNNDTNVPILDNVPNNQFQFSSLLSNMYLNFKQKSTEMKILFLCICVGKQISV